MKFSESPLHQAAVEGDSETIRRLLDDGVEIDSVIDGGYTALMGACAAGRAEGAQLLIERGADVNAGDCQNRHALLYAALKEASTGDPRIVAALLNAGADVNRSNDWGETALLFAAGGNRDLAVVRILLEHGAIVDGTNGYGQTALMEAAESGQIETVEELLKYHASLTVRDIYGKTAWQVAKDNHHDAIAELLGIAADQEGNLE